MTPPTVTSHQIGDFQVTVLSDGNMSASLELLKGITPSDAGQIQHEAGITAPGNIHINGYLIRGLGKTLLVAGMHFALPGFAHIVPQEEGYRLVYPTADSQ
ncbi:hypothetical protein PUATCC27989T_03321 [Phytobacter ursingii]|uniref:Uncharacterized protein n=1 Tax=Phytobacter ursingii TaxID=1972431 RepID=A0AAC8QR40_9ENTR|nr:hypothetical protein AB182_20330 [Phytobacter ursingii]GJL35968.1 hypothetical protein TUM17576_27880 [Enterobacter hormaechei]VTP15427.1 hypothetical protein PUATCC27989T_03321 [Phytobacter ursingii]